MAPFSQLLDPKMLRVFVVLFSLLVAGSVCATEVGPLDKVTCSWLGNPFPGTGVGQWVQQDIDDLFVATGRSEEKRKTP
jgi:hypothetical protein